MIQDMAVIQADTGQPSFVWSTDGNTYQCIAGLSQFNRSLVDGGFTVEQMLTITVPRYDTEGSPIFPNDIIPQAQQRVVFNNKSFRIENVKQDSVYNYGTDGVATTTSGVRLRIVAIGITKGI
jgi:hypothetical protein